MAAMRRSGQGVRAWGERGAHRPGRYPEIASPNGTQADPSNRTRRICFSG